LVFPIVKGKIKVMEGADWLLDPVAHKAFAKANLEERTKHLLSFTLERAALELERILDLGPEIWKASQATGVPMLPKSMPGPSLAIILGGDPPPEEEETGGFHHGPSSKRS
jgi:hypothetical protein